MAKDVIVVVKRDALPTTKESLDILLISTTGAQPVGVYRDVESVKAVYGDDGKTPNSKIVRKATTLMNQGKTTLAETLVNKFKIVALACRLMGGATFPSTPPAVLRCRSFSMVPRPTKARNKNYLERSKNHV